MEQHRANDRKCALQQLLIIIIITLLLLTIINNNIKLNRTKGKAITKENERKERGTYFD